MGGTVIFLGAGATKSCRGPQTGRDLLEVVYLLKRSLGRSPPRAPASIRVVEYDEKNPNLPADKHVAGRRYCALFGDAIDWHSCGLDAWLRSRAVETEVRTQADARQS
jgi:hypothetical protein